MTSRFFTKTLTDPGRLCRAVLLFTGVLLVLWAPFTPAQEPPVIPSAQTDFMPSWARKTWTQLLQAKAQPGYLAEYKAAKDLPEVTPEQKTKKEAVLKEAREKAAEHADALYKLDFEVDMLAGALLNLREPADVVEMYNVWYEENTKEQAGIKTKEKRTPASILLQARGMRGRAHSRMAQAGGDPMQRFRDASIDLLKALAMLTPVRESLQQVGGLVMKQPGQPAPTLKSVTNLPLFLQFMEYGLPKPVTADDVPEMVRPATVNTVGKHRIAFPPFHARDAVLDCLRWEARIARELGDLIYRETGGGLQPRRGDGGQATASAYYQHARLVLYQARLMDGADKFLAAEAEELEARIRWIRSGLPFGGRDFYQFASYRPGAYFTDHERQLRSLLATLQQRAGEGRRDLAAAQSQLQNEANASAGREQLEVQFKAQMTFGMRARMSDLGDRILDLQSQSAQAALGLAAEELELFGLGQGLELDQMKYRGELERERQRVTGNILQTLTDLRALGSLEILRGYVADDPWTQVEAFMKSHPSPSVRESWNLWQGPDAPATLQAAVDKVLVDSTKTRALVTESRLDGEIASRKSSWIKASKDLELALAEKQFFEAKMDLEQQKASAEAVTLQLADVDKELAGIPELLKDEEKKKEKTSTYDYLKQRALPNLESDWGRANERVNKLKSNLAQFRGEVQKARKTVNDIKKAAETVEKTYDRFKSLIDSVSFQPVVIGGTLSGSYVDVGSAFDRIGKAALQKLEQLYTKMKDSKDMDAFLQNLEEQAKAAEDKIAATQQDANDRKEKFENQLRTSKQLQYFMPDEAFRKQFEEMLLKIEEARGNITKEIGKAGLGTYADDSDAFQRKKKKWAEAALKAADKAKDAVGRARQKLNGLLAGPDETTQGKAWAEIQQTKLNLEQRKIEIEASLAAAQAEVSQTQALIAGHDLAQLTRKVEGAVGAHDAAYSDLAGAVGRQTSLWQQLTACLEAWDTVKTEDQNLGDFVGRFKAEWQRHLKTFDSAKMVSETVRKASESREAAVTGELTVLAAELQSLRVPARRMLVGNLMERIAPALTLMQDKDSTDEETTRLLEEANGQALALARWLYAFTGDQRAVFHAAPSRNLAELELTVRGLDKLAAELRTKFGSPGGGAIVLTISKEALDAARGTGTTASGLPLFLSQSSARRDGPPQAKWTYLVRTPQAFAMESPEAPPKGYVAAAYEVPPQLAPGGALRYDLQGLVPQGAIIAGMVPVIAWEGAHPLQDQFSILPRGHVRAALAPDRPVLLRYPSLYGVSERSHPASPDTAAAFFALMCDPLQRPERQKFLEAPEQTALLSGGMSGLLAFGRPLEGAFWLDLDKPALAGARDIKLCVFYVAPQLQPLQPTDPPRRVLLAEALGVSGAAAPSLPAAAAPPHPDGEWLARMQGLIDQWDKGINKGDVPATAALTERIPKVLNRLGEVPQDNPNRGSIFEPVPINGVMAGTVGLLQVLVAAVHVQHSELQKVAATLDATKEARAGILNLAGSLRREREHLSALNEYATWLTQLQNGLDGNQLTADRQDALVTLTQRVQNHFTSLLAAEIATAAARNDKTRLRMLHVLADQANQVDAKPEEPSPPKP